MKERMLALAMSFPSYRDKIAGETVSYPGWDAPRVLCWVEEASSVERRVYRFLLFVWDASENHFDLRDALLVWDAEHRAAFLAWAQEPWWA